LTRTKNFPNQKVKRVSILIPVTLIENLKKVSADSCRSLTGQVSWILQNYVAERTINENNTTV